MKTLKKCQSIEECLQFLNQNDDIENAIVFSQGFDQTEVWTEIKKMIVGYYNNGNFKIENIVKGPYFVQYEAPDLKNVGFDEIIKNKDKYIMFRRKNRRSMTLSKNGPATYVFDIEKYCNFQISLEDITARDWEIFFLEGDNPYNYNWQRKQVHDWIDAERSQTDVSLMDL